MSISDVGLIKLAEKIFKDHYIISGVFKLRCEFFDSPKYKRLIIIAKDPELLMIPINSGIRPFIRKRPNLEKLQVGLKCDLEDVIEHDSYADCSNLFDQFDRNYLHNDIMVNPGHALGFISKDSLKFIVDAIEQAVTIEPIRKKIIKKAYNEYIRD